ncbi:MAG: hypothetical protein RRC34_12420 [Lentisphaeria bacterium]|nr:hypothetical protein [Lentisphaeria bacterium]
MKKTISLIVFLSLTVPLLVPASQGAEVDPVTKANVSRFWGVAEDQLSTKYEYERAAPPIRSAPVSLARQAPRSCARSTPPCHSQPAVVYVPQVQSRPVGGPRIENEESSQVKNRRKTLGFNILGDVNLFNISMDEEAEDNKAAIKGKL